MDKRNMRLAIDSKVLDLCEMEPEISRMLDEVAEELCPEFVDYCEDLGKIHEDNIDWWVTDIATRNTFASPLFLNCCRLILIERLLNEGCKYNTIMVDSVSLKKDLEYYLHKHKLNIKVVNGYKKVAGTKDLLKRSVFIRLLNSIINTLRPWWAARMTAKTRCPIPAEELILLDNFVLDNSFTNEGYQERYYPGLENYLNSSEAKRIYYLPTYYQIKNHCRLFIQMRASEYNFCLKEDLLHMTDYIFAFGFYWRARRLVRNASNFRGFSINNMIYEQLDANRCASSSFDALLKYRFVFRSKQSGIKVHLLVDWFENQVIDHGLNAGFRRWYPDTPIKGYQCFPLSPYYLSLFPTEQEYRSKVIPTEISVMGPGYICDARQYCPSIKVDKAPGLRFVHLWQNENSLNQREKKVLFVALPYAINENSIILAYLERLMMKIPDDKWHIVLKAHPATSQQMIRNLWKGNWPERLVFVEGDTGSILNGVDLVLTMTSTICLETVARGIPVAVIANSSGITHRYIPSSVPADMWQLCYTPDEVLDFVNKIAEIDESNIQEFKTIGENIKQLYFTPVDTAGVRDFLNLER